jgi:hypothetical protein
MAYKTPESFFINNAKTDFESIFIKNSDELQKSVNQLFDSDLLNHDLTKAYDLEAKFDKYWAKYESSWHLLDLNNDGVFELLFNNSSNEPEHLSFELFKKENQKYEAIYFQIGKLVGYKIHPNTKEVILFRHQYPCCTNLSHNVDMIRYLNGKITLRKKFFVARPDEMKTKLFPKKVSYTKEYLFLSKDEKVRWSAEVITKNATRMSQENIISKYPKGTPYRVLAVEKGWKYVLICGEPSKDLNKIINPANFIYTHVFGWVKK